MSLTVFQFQVSGFQHGGGVVLPFKEHEGQCLNILLSLPKQSGSEVLLASSRLRPWRPITAPHNKDLSSQNSNIAQTEESILGILNKKIETISKMEPTNITISRFFFESFFNRALFSFSLIE